MPCSTKLPRAPDGISALLRDIVHERTGIYFEDSRMNDLMEKLAPAAAKAGHESFLTYYYALKDDDFQEWNRLYDALCVLETYFGRENSQVKALTAEIIPKWFESRTGTFKIWCAACASGEEPYSIAMALIEAGMEDLPIEIMASDTSPAALKKAETAIYREMSFRGLSQAMREKYFNKTPEGWKLSKRVSNKVKFRQANLYNAEDIGPLARAQAVFCRNVFIYFSQHSIRMTVATIAARMPAGGCLFVGAAESLMRMTTDFELKNIEGALGYVRI